MNVQLNNATRIGSVQGVNFYEHPIHGDEAGLIAVHNNEQVQTDWYDLPEIHDIESAADFMSTYR